MKVFYDFTLIQSIFYSKIPYLNFVCRIDSSKFFNEVFYETVVQFFMLRAEARCQKSLTFPQFC